VYLGWYSSHADYRPRSLVLVCIWTVLSVVLTENIRDAVQLF
jgi:hypothetical protein